MAAPAPHHPMATPDRHGRAVGVNVLTATRRGRRWRRQRRNFWIVSRPRWVAENIFKRRPLAATLKRLDFLHVGGWYRIGTFPAIEGAVPEDDDYRWVVFVANFNGDWGPYRDSFMEVLAHGVYTVWGSTVGFPGFPGPASRWDLEAWVDGRRVESGHYYCAYPGATTHDVRAALRVTRELSTFLSTRAAVPPSLAAFTPGPAEFGQLLHRLSNCLGESVPTQKPWPACGPAGANGFTSLVSVAPILPHHVAALRNEIAGLGTDRSSPFADVPGTHFARLAIIDRSSAGVHPRHHVPLNNSWLLLAADFDADLPRRHAELTRAPEPELQRYFDAIGTVARLAPLWNHCVGRDRSPTLPHYLRQTVLDRLVRVSDYPSVTLREVLTALQVHQLLRTRLDANPVRTALDLDHLAADIRVVMTH